MCFAENCAVGRNVLFKVQAKGDEIDSNSWRGHFHCLRPSKEHSDSGWRSWSSEDLKQGKEIQESATIVSVGPNAPPKEKKEETKKEEKKVAVVVVPDQAPNFCQRCDVWHHWYVTVEDHGYNYCSIL